MARCAIRQVLVVGLSAHVGCGGSIDAGSKMTCSNIATPPIEATVTDAQTGAYICNASVVAIGNGVTMNLTELSAPDGSCTYLYSSNAAAGVYVVSVGAPGFLSAKKEGVAVLLDSCAVAQKTQMVAIQLTPAK